MRALAGGMTSPRVPRWIEYSTVLFKNHLPYCLGQNVLASGPVFDGYAPPAACEEFQHRLFVEKALLLSTDGVKPRLDLRIPAGAMIMIVGGIEPAREHAIRTQDVSNPGDDGDRLNPREVVQRKARDHHAEVLRASGKRLAHVTALDRRVGYPGTCPGYGFARKIERQDLQAARCSVAVSSPVPHPISTTDRPPARAVSNGNQR